MKQLVILGVFFSVFLALPHFSIAATSIETTIIAIQAQDNRTWIDVTPDIGVATNCALKSSVEISNGMENRDLIMSLAMSAMLAGKSVKWITTDICSNVNRDLVRGLKIIN